MEQKNNHNKKPSFLLTLFFIVSAFALPYTIIHYSNNKPRPVVKELPAPMPVVQKQVPIKKEHKEKEWKFIITQQGDSLSTLFKKLNISHKVLSEILAQSPYASRLKSIKPNQKLRFLFTDKKELIRLIIPITVNQSLSIRKKEGKYLSTINTKKMQSHLHYITATIHDSLYATAKHKHIPYKLIKQMTHIFNWEIDFSKDVRDNDQFTILYKAYYLEDNLVGVGDIIAISYTNKGKTHKAIRYAIKDRVEYYTPRGKNLRKAFTRFPVKFSHISSRFSNARVHPVLNHVVRPHKGVDLAARIGTPIKATADGIIAHIGRNGGYGNMIKIRHNRRYQTIYAHMLRFQKGLSRGSRVKRGQVIGFVGQTGLADGPHCHFEFHINNIPRNPVTVELPRGPSVPRKHLAEFKARSQTLLAQLQLYHDAQQIKTKTA